MGPSASGAGTMRSFAPSDCCHRATRVPFPRALGIACRERAEAFTRKCRALLATPWRMASADMVPPGPAAGDPGAHQGNEVRWGAPTPLPPLFQNQRAPVPAYNWDEEFPEGLDFSEEVVEEEGQWQFA